MLKENIIFLFDFLLGKNHIPFHNMVSNLNIIVLKKLFLKKKMKGLYQALGVYLPLITTNCAVLGVALTNVSKDYSILEGVVNGFATSVGFLISIVIMAGLREKMEYNNVPKAFRGMPIVLLTACLMAIAFFGFSGLK